MHDTFLTRINGLLCGSSMHALCIVCCVLYWATVAVANHCHPYIQLYASGQVCNDYIVKLHHPNFITQLCIAANHWRMLIRLPTLCWCICHKTWNGQQDLYLSMLIRARPTLGCNHQFSICTTEVIATYSDQLTKITWYICTLLF